MAKNRISMSLLVVGLLGVAAGLSACGSSRSTGVVRFEALAGNMPIDESSPGNPVRLQEGEPLELTLLVTNVTSVPVVIRSIELEGRILGLTFLTSRTGIDETVFPGEEQLIRFPVDLYGLDGQADGLLRGRIVLRGADDRALASNPVVLDGRGGVLSVTSLFTLVLFVVGLIGLAATFLRFLREGLPDERRLRGAQFVPTGIAFGLALSAAGSTARIWPLPATLWLLITALMAAAAYIIGVYLPPLRGGHPLETIDLTARPGPPITISGER